MEEYQRSKEVQVLVILFWFFFWVDLFSCSAKVWIVDYDTFWATNLRFCTRLLNQASSSAFRTTPALINMPSPTPHQHAHTYIPTPHQHAHANTAPTCPFSHGSSISPDVHAIHPSLYPIHMIHVLIHKHCTHIYTLQALILKVYISVLFLLPPAGVHTYPRTLLHWAEVLLDSSLVFDMIFRLLLDFVSLWTFWKSRIIG